MESLKKYGFLLKSECCWGLMKGREIYMLLSENMPTLHHDFPGKVNAENNKNRSRIK